MTISLHRASNYSFGLAEDEEEDLEKVKIPPMEKLRQRFQKEGTVRSVRCIILVHEHNHPNIMLLRNRTTNDISIPGGRLLTGEDDETGIHRILNKKLCPINADFEIGEHIATWYRPQFTEYVYPYLPAHITTAKEIEKWYVVFLPETAKLRAQAKNEPTILPFYQINGNPDWQGKPLGEVPVLMSKFDFSYAD